jgi:hypothetical protein
MPTLRDNLKKEQGTLDLEQENTHGDYEKMKVVFKKKIQLYKRYLKKEGLTELADYDEVAHLGLINRFVEAKTVRNFLLTGISKYHLANISSKMHKAFEYEGIMHITKLGPA